MLHRTVISQRVLQMRTITEDSQPVFVQWTLPAEDATWKTRTFIQTQFSEFKNSWIHGEGIVTYRRTGFRKIYFRGENSNSGINRWLSEDSWNLVKDSLLGRSK